MSQQGAQGMVDGSRDRKRRAWGLQLGSIEKVSARLSLTEGPLPIRPSPILSERDGPSAPRPLRNTTLLILFLTCSLLSSASIQARTDWPIVFPAFTNETGESDWDWLSAVYPEVARSKLHGTIHMRAFTWEEINHVVSLDPNVSGNLVEISRQLRAQLLIRGAYKTVGESIEVSARCVDPVSGRPLTTFKSMGSIHDPAEAINDILTQIAQALRIALPPEDAESIRRPSTRVVDALRAHSMGLLALNREDARQSAVSDATRHFTEATSLDPAYADAHYRLATLLQHKKDTAGAESAYRAALRADIDHRDARYRLGLLLISLDRKSEAMTELEQALKQAPEDPQMQSALSSIWFDQYQSNFAQMADGLKQAIAANPDDPQLYVELGSVYEELGQIDEASGQYQMALSKKPNHPDANYKLGMILRNTGSRKEGITYLRKAVSSGTHMKRVHFYLGETLMELEDYAAAAEAFTKAVEIEPNNTPGFFQLGKASALAGKHQDALLAYSKYSQINKTDAKPHLEIGKAYAAMGLPRQARTAYKRSVEVDPRFADGHIAIGRLYEAENLTFRAAKAFKEALEIAPDHPEAKTLRNLVRKYQPAPSGAKR